jgi:prepilin-type N-terminal cleavage/methylation domain-containing protein
MHPRTVGRLCHTPIRSSSAFHRTEPRGRERHGRAAHSGERAEASESKALQRPHAAPGFTLIELLVVIGIIAILVGLLFPAFKAVQNQARQTQAKNDLTQIVNAVAAFYTEYGKYPLPGTTADYYTYGPVGDTTNNNLFYALRAIAGGSINGGDAANPRKIVFISPPEVKNPSNPRSGIALQATTINGISVAIGEFVDPWGTPYNVRIDANYDNRVVNPYGAQTVGGAGSDPVTLGIIAWSRGSDQALGTRISGITGDNIYRNPTTGAQSDDVISWQ